MKQYGGRGELTRRSLLAGGAGVLLTVGHARAQSFPNGPVKIVTSVGPGAAPDIISRMVADHLTQLWGQQVIVFNQPGGAGAVAIRAVAPATPDGHTLYMALASNFIALPELQKNFPVDLVRDFVPIGFVGEQPLGIAVTPALGVNTLPELIALLKSKPGEFNVAAGNRGSILHLAGEWLRSATGTKFTLLHYTGGAKALPDVLGGRVQVDIDALASMRGAIDSGQLKLLAVTTDKRIRTFPQVPAVAETLPGFRAVRVDGADGAARYAGRGRAQDQRRSAQGAGQYRIGQTPRRTRHLRQSDHAGGADELHPRAAADLAAGHRRNRKDDQVESAQRQLVCRFVPAEADQSHEALPCDSQLARESNG